MRHSLKRAIFLLPSVAGASFVRPKSKTQVLGVKIGTQMIVGTNSRSGTLGKFHYWKLKNHRIYGQPFVHFLSEMPTRRHLI